MNIDRQRGERAAVILYNGFRNEGVHGQTNMTEDILPDGVGAGSLEHIVYITLTMAVNYQRDIRSLWAAARRTFGDEATRYLFCPAEIQKVPANRVAADLQKYGLAKYADKDAYIWRTVSLSLFKNYDGDPVNLFKQCNWYANVILDKVRNARHYYKNREYPDFPYLRGDNIGPYWLKVLRDRAGLSFVNMDRVLLPVGMHVARSTLSLGVVRGRYAGDAKPLFDLIRKAWSQSVQGQIADGGRKMIALDLGEPLWHLSRHGCASRDEQGACARDYCLAQELCVPGSINISSRGRVYVNT